jgi:queuine tRNA-ribosyltransferase
VEATCVIHRDGRARVGELLTPHGLVHTPAFMPVGTHGAVKGLLVRDLLEIGTEILLANTYHLFLRPGDELIARRGGLHRFLGWPRPLLTDSGGYQVFSLATHRTVSEEGVEFRSHLDGRRHLLTPEGAAEIQLRLGSDIAMVLDECVAYPSSRGEAEQAMARTLRWARRGRARFLAAKAAAEGRPTGSVTNPGQVQFGIVQGGAYPDLRRLSVEETVALEFDGYGIGGLSVGEPLELMYELVALTAPRLPEDRPRYLMGTGMPDDLFEAVAQGVDLFDCVLPTRNGRNGQLFTRHGVLNIKQARYAEDDAPPDPDCPCYTCRHTSRAYLRHLFLAREMTAATLNSLHNLFFYLDTLRQIREAIAAGSFEGLRQRFRQTFSRRPRP